MTKKNKPVNVAGYARNALKEDIAARAAVVDARKGDDNDLAGQQGVTTVDSFVNFAHKMGIGADNALSSGSYGFNPVTRNRVQLEWIHRGSWLGGVAVDVVADDMTRSGVSLEGQLRPEDIRDIEEAATELQVWPQLNDTVKWARLYGGAIAVMMVEGQDYSTPLRLETIGKDQFKGLLVLDRWMVEPTLQDLVTDAGPDIGLPKFYRITAQAPALPNLKIHYSRCIRLEGIRLSYWQRLQENLWGLSVLERLYDRMIAFDSASTGAAQLVYKAFIRTYKVKDLRQIIAAGGDALNGLVKYTDMMRRFQGVEGITLLDGEDEFEAGSHVGFGGLSDALTQFAQQLAGALQIPLVRLFGQSPSGFSTGDTDLRMYYDSIKQQQEKTLKVGVTRVYRAIAQSRGIKLPKGFGIQFRPLWQLTQAEKADIASKVATAVTTAKEYGLVSDQVAMEELRQSSSDTGIFSNITDKIVKAADDGVGEPLPMAIEVVKGENAIAKAKATPKPAAPKGKTKDSVQLAVVASLGHLWNLQVVIENEKNTTRYGDGWQTVLPADYGYIRGYDGADGDQIDCYIGPVVKYNGAYVVNQRNLETGEFDEHKVLIGFENEQAALICYLQGFSDHSGSERIMSLRNVTMQQFKTWLETGNLKQPFEG